MVIDTDDDALVRFTLGTSLEWRSEERLYGIDLGVELGGDTTNVDGEERQDR